MLPGPRHRGPLLCGRYLLAPLTGNKEGSKSLMVLPVGPTPIRFPTSSLYTSMDSTPLHSISSVCHPWGKCCRVQKIAMKRCNVWHSFSISVPMRPRFPTSVVQLTLHRFNKHRLFSKRCSNISAVTPFDIQEACSVK